MQEHLLGPRGSCPRTRSHAARLTMMIEVRTELFDRHEHIREQMKALCGMIHEVDPDIPIYSSA